MATGSSDSHAAAFVRALRTNALYAIIALNAVVFVGMAVCAVCGARSVASALALPPSFGGLLHMPWTLLTYMVVHTDAMHLVFNMLWLYCFGSLMMRCGTCPGRRLAAVYTGGGVAGGLVFLCACSLAPAMSAGPLLGASAAVLAVAVAVAFEMPDMELHFWLIGAVRLKWVVAAMVLLFCIGFTGSAAATAAHAGGAAYGAVAHYADALLLRRRRSATKADMREELDALLDKVKLSGYEALSRRDKQRLFELSHKVKP